MSPRMLSTIVLLTVLRALAQTPPIPSAEPVIHTVADLQLWEAKATEAAQASPPGLGISRLDDFGNDYTLLVVRLRTGEAERHQFFADEVKGSTTIVVGGTMQAEHASPGRPGETLGSSVAGGKDKVLHAGEVAHIPAGIPHWVKLAPGTATTYLVFKEKEPEDQP
jgi:hypothetical protein